MIICYGNNKFRYYMYIYMYYVKKHFDMKKLLFVYVVLYLTFICSLLFSYILFGKNAEIKKSNQKNEKLVTRSLNWQQFEKLTKHFFSIKTGHLLNILTTSLPMYIK